MKALLVVVLVAACTSSGSPPPEVYSTYHLPGQVDEVNLTIREDGTFAWRIFGCDFGFRVDGRWEADGEAIVLLPTAGEAHLSWVHGGTFAYPVESVRVRREGAGILVEHVDFEQTWSEGRICATCPGGGFLGPSRLDLCADQSGL